MSPVRLILMVGGTFAIVLLVYVYGNRSSVTTEMSHSNNVEIKTTTAAFTTSEATVQLKGPDEQESTTAHESTATASSSSVVVDGKPDDVVVVAPATTVATVLTAKRGFASQLPTQPFNMKDYDTVFLYHSRIAGGGILREWLGKVCKIHNITLEAKEGYVLDDADFEANKDNSFNPTGRTLFITSLRDPVDRAIASYWQEGHPDETKFLDWVEDKSTKDHGASNFIWFCHSNCYTRWFGAESYNRAKYFDMHRAANRLSKFDVVVRAEHLHDESYNVALQTLLNAESIPVPPGPSGERISSANITATYHITEDELTLLKGRNKMDQDLMDVIFGSSGSSD
jgi:hypothetical protein